MAAPNGKRRREFLLLQLLPNFITFGAIAAGLTAIRQAIEGNFQVAVGLIVLAAVLDGMDGRLARLLKSESAIGAELDSLADFVNFGVAPGIVLYLWAFDEAQNLGWIAALVYAICCVLRLARFNVDARSPRPEGASNDFIGVPSPAGALLAMLPVYLGFLLPEAPHVPELVVGLWMVLVGLAMISRVPTPSLKSARIYAENVPFAMIAFVTLTAALVTYPWATLVAISLAYLAALLWAWQRNRRR
ncbi:MAG: CDP-diacylglycerol--serine O-phosphatidyltransferase [Rhodobacteraceae bacterium]|nr:CDP-diacylglycerol--serine O-phosphatidyltransferase [Paracoccaceae bacterium]